MAAEEQLANLLGADWQNMSWGRLLARTRGLERAAGFAEALVAYMSETGAKTAGDALKKLQAAPVAGLAPRSQPPQSSA
jgi:hypothetical protein